MSVYPKPEPFHKLKRIQINERGEPLVDLNQYPLAVHQNALPFVRKGIAERLVRAQTLLPKPYKLLVIDGLQSTSSLNQLWLNHYKQLEEAHPFWPAVILHSVTNTAHTPASHHPHTTGAAVDVVLTDEAGTLFDVLPPPSNANLVHINSRRVPIGAQHRRQLLREVMEKVGFSNFPHEYWHYSYGDVGWAVRRGLKSCFYGPIAEIDTIKNAFLEGDL